MSHTIINTLLAVANTIVVVWMWRQYLVVKADLRRAEFDAQAWEGAFNLLEKDMLDAATAHQRELDALRAKHMEEFAAQKAETEMYMEAARRLKAELDAMKGVG